MTFLALIVLFGTELWLLIEVGAVTSALLVVLWVGLGVVFGLNVMRRGAQRAAVLSQEGAVSTVMTPLGLMVMRREARSSPGELLDAMGLVFAGFLFAMPGLVSDVFGLALLVGPLRRAVMGRLMALRAPGRDRPRERAREPRGQPAADVEVLPPGSLPQSPLRKRPVVIDVE